MKKENDRLDDIEEKLDDLQDTVDQLYAIILALNEKVLDSL